MAAIRRILLVLLIFLYVEKKSLAQTNVEIVGSYMHQSGNGGRQVADDSGRQGLTVYEPVLYLDSKITPDTTVFFSGMYDLWTSASEAIFDSKTSASAGGASGGLPGTVSTKQDLQQRKAFDLGVSQKISTWTLTPTFGYSYEFDYHSYHGGFQVDKSFANDNFVLSAACRLFYDDAHPFVYTVGRFADWRSKKTHTFEISGSQILTPSDLVLVGYTFTRQSGFLAGNQNTVSVAGTRISEELPDSRYRHAFTLRYVHGWSDTVAGHLDYRYYLDSWGLNSHTVEPSIYLGFNDEQGIVKLFYRFYYQNAVDYYQYAFASPETYMTSDSDLQNFTANEVGAMISYSWDLDSFLTSVSLSGTALYYRRTNDLNAEVFQVGIGGTF